MEEIRVFAHPMFGEVRVTGTNENPYFCLVDVCKALELTPKGVKQRLEDEVISNYPIEDSMGRTQQALFVSEDEISNIIDDINRKIGELNEKYPRLKQSLKANLSIFDYCDFDNIVVKWEDKNHTTCCVIRFVLAKGILVDGVVQDNE